MGTESRREDPGLRGPNLFDEPYRFDFIQAVRLIQGARGERAFVGHKASPGDEAVRFSAYRHLGFPASQIHALEPGEEGRPHRMTVSFLGLTGPSGVLPTHYSELVIEEADPEGRPGPLAAFFDMFNHRFLSYFYRAWERNHPHLSNGEETRAAFHGYILAFLGELTGFHTASALDRIRHAALWGQKRRTAEGLAILTLDLVHGSSRTEPTGVNVEVEPFVPRWIEIDDDQRFRIGGESPSAGAGLGKGTLLGRRVRNWQGHFRIRIGPLSSREFKRLQPAPARGLAVNQPNDFEKLKALASSYAGPEHTFDIVLTLAPRQVRRSRIGGRHAAKLGRTWLITKVPAKEVEAGFRATNSD